MLRTLFIRLARRCSRCLCCWPATACQGRARLRGAAICGPLDGPPPRVLGLALRSTEVVPTPSGSPRRRSAAGYLYGHPTRRQVFVRKPLGPPSPRSRSNWRSSVRCATPKRPRPLAGCRLRIDLDELAGLRVRGGQRRCARGQGAPARAAQRPSPSPRAASASPPQRRRPTRSAGWPSVTGGRIGIEPRTARPARSPRRETRPAGCGPAAAPEPITTTGRRNCRRFTHNQEENP